MAAARACPLATGWAAAVAYRAPIYADVSIATLADLAANAVGMTTCRAALAAARASAEVVPTVRAGILADIAVVMCSM